MQEIDLGYETTPIEDPVQAQDMAIRTGDLDLLDETLEQYDYLEPPVMKLDSVSLLEQANHDALRILDEREYTVLDDAVRTIIYDDPDNLGDSELDIEMVYLVLKYDAYEVFLSRESEVFDILKEEAKKGIVGKYLSVIHGDIAERIQETMLL